MAKQEIKCCIGCGRETSATTGICFKCRSHVRSTAAGSRGYADKPAPQQFEFDCDKFDDESGPNDIFDDGVTWTEDPRRNY